MADKANNLGGIRSDPGTERHPLSSTIPVEPGTYIVGKYDEFGHQRKSSEPADHPSDAARIRKLLVESMTTRGGRLLPGFTMTANGPVKINNLPIIAPTTPSQAKPAVARQTKKKAASIKLNDLPALTDPEPPMFQRIYEPDITEPKKATRNFPIIFKIESGNIRSSVDAILEDDLAIMLVYSDSEAISYEPARGSELTLILPDKRKVDVMYSSIKFRWYMTSQECLIFIKAKNSITQADAPESQDENRE